MYRGGVVVALSSCMKGPGVILLTGGAASVVVAIVFALRPLGALYGALLEDPMADTVPEQTVARQMLWALAWGLPGVVCLFVGKVMLRREARRRRGGMG